LLGITRARINPSGVKRMTQENGIQNTAQPRIAAGWLAVLIGSLLCVIVGLLWWTLDRREKNNLHNKIKSEAEYLATHVDSDLRNRIPALRRMARMWETHAPMSKEEFFDDGQSYLLDTPGFQALEWVDRNFFVRWVVPLEGNRQAQGLNLAFERKRRIALEKAEASRLPTMTAPIDLVQGGKGFLVYFPIYVRGEFKGFVLAVFRIQEWLDYIFMVREQNVSDNFRVSVNIDDVPVFRQDGWEQTEFNKVAYTKILDHRLSINIQPTRTYLERNKTLMPGLTALFGILLSGLVASVVYLLQKTFIKAWAIHSAKMALEVESLAHRKTGKELQYTLTRLDLATKAGGIGVWTWDLSSDALTWNEQMFSLYDIPPDVTPSYDTWRSLVHPDDLPAAESLLKNAVAGRAVFNTEFRIRHATGAVRYLIAAARVERDNAGKPLRVTGINRDITYRKCAEEALRESEEKFRGLSQSSPVAILLYQGDFWIYANPAAESMSGYSLRELLTMRYWDFIHPEYRELIRGNGEKRQRGDAIAPHYEAKIIARDGAEKWIDISGSTTMVGGKPAGIVSFLDITQRKAAEKALMESEEQVRLLLNSTAEAIYGIDLAGRCTFANPACLRMLGYSGMEQVLGKNMHYLIHHSFPNGEPMPIESCRIFQAFRGGERVHVDDEDLWRADGSSFPVEYWSYPQMVGGKIAGAVVTFIDITERKRAEELLAEEKRRLSFILEGTNVGTWEWNVLTGETVFNERWSEIIGYSLEELAPLSIDTWTRFVHPDDLKLSNQLLEQHFSGEMPYYECEARMRHKNGAWVWVLDRGKVVVWSDEGKPLLMSGTHQEITQRKLAEEQIQHMATHDGLTNLPTLRLANDRLSFAISLARRQRTMVAVMFIDLDGFKSVNDNLGHDAGDFVLKQVALRFSSCVRETDTVARVGGDEFLLIVTGIQAPENAERMAEKILQVVSLPIDCNGRQAVVGASIGIAFSPRDGYDGDHLIKLADEAMYAVKNSGKNGYRFAASVWCARQGAWCASAIKSAVVADL